MVELLSVFVGLLSFSGATVEGGGYILYFTNLKILVIKPPLRTSYTNILLMRLLRLSFEVSICHHWSVELLEFVEFGLNKIHFKASV